MLYLCTG